MQKLQHRIQDFIYHKTAAGDYCSAENGDRADLRDFLLCFRPSSEIMAALLLLQTLGYVSLLRSFNFTPLSNVVLGRAALATIDPLYFGGLLVVLFQTIATVGLWLRDELFIWFLRATFALLIILKALAFVRAPSASLMLHDSGKIIWFTFLLIATTFSSRRLFVTFFSPQVSRRMRPKGFPPRKPGRYRLLLIQPSTGMCEAPYSLRRNWYPGSLPYLAALAPPNWDVMVLDTVWDQVPYDLDVDVVGLTCWAITYHSTKTIAEGFRRRGKSVILGGPDVSWKPSAYESFCDSLLVGDAEGLFPSMLDDFVTGQMKKEYRSTGVFNLKGMVHPRYDLLPPRRYGNTFTILVSTSCPFHCAFCNYNRTREPRLRPVADVVAAVKATPGGRYFWFEAPELLAYKPYVRELETALRGKRIEWASHATMRSSSDPATLRSAHNAGMRAVWLGVESYSQESLKFANKAMNRVETFHETFRMLAKMGISANVHLIFGFPTDTLADYDRAVDGVIAGKVSSVQIYPLAIHYGDEAFEQKVIAAGGHVFSIFDKVEFKKPTFKYYAAKGISEREMMDAWEKCHRRLYSFSSIFKRLFTRSARSLPQLLPDLLMNLIWKTQHRSFQGLSWHFERVLAERLETDLPLTRRLLESAELDSQNAVLLGGVD